MIAKVPVSLERFIKCQGMTAVRLVGQAGGFLPQRQSLDIFSFFLLPFTFFFFTFTFNLEGVRCTIVEVPLQRLTVL